MRGDIIRWKIVDDFWNTQGYKELMMNPLLTGRYIRRGLSVLALILLAGCSQTQKTPDVLVNLPVAESAKTTAQALRSAMHVPQNRYEDAVQLKGISADQLKAELADPPHVGDRLDFYINYDLVNDYRPVAATLRYVSENAAWWVADNASVTDDELRAAASNFESTPFKIDRLMYGSESIPGIDNYDRVHFLFVRLPEWGEFYGYFSTINLYPKIIQPYSNEKEMLVINVGSTPLDSLQFAGELGHEFSHLIQFSVDPYEDLWLNEALSELSAFMTISPPPGTLMEEGNQQVFAKYPFIQLTARPETNLPEDDRNITFAHYGAEKLFTIYLLDRFGPVFIKQLVANPEAGVRSIDQELQKLDPPLTFNDVYADWILANLMNQPDNAQGRFGYQEIQTLLPSIISLDSFTGENLPGYMPPYSTFYYELHANEKLNVKFRGAAMARLTPQDPFEGEYVWYSNRGDETSFMMTRSFDLSGVKSATLKYSVWYELEKDFDYGYVLVSDDDGVTWTVLKTKYGTSENLSSDAYGPGYTGESTDWLKESLDLSAYAGRKIMVRFIVNTDLATNRDGMMLDNIEIPQIKYFDGAEDDRGGWDVQGFVRSSNLVPAEWIVWLVKVNTDPDLKDEVIRIKLDDLQTADFDIEGFGQAFDFAALVISPMAPTTTMNLDYEILLTGQ
jgi:immune inhibitor A